MWRILVHVVASMDGTSCTPTLFFFFFNDTATTEIYPLSLHDALPICGPQIRLCRCGRGIGCIARLCEQAHRSEEHTSELQSRLHLVCRLLLEKKKKAKTYNTPHSDTTETAHDSLDVTISHTFYLACHT